MASKYFGSEQLSTSFLCLLIIHLRELEIRAMLIELCTFETVNSPFVFYLPRSELLSRFTFPFSPD